MDHKIEKFTTIALVGKPNAGKSTLINQIIGYDLSIVTHKAQTTRKNIRGIYNVIDNTNEQHTKIQLVFTDTPGLFDAEHQNNLEKYQVNNAWAAIKLCDFIAFVFSAVDDITDEQLKIVKRIFTNYGKCTTVDNTNITRKSVGQGQKKLIALLNKIDLDTRHTVQNNHSTYVGDIQQTHSYHAHPSMVTKQQDHKSSKCKTNVIDIQALHMFDKVFPISALLGTGIDDVLQYISTHAPQKHCMFAEDIYTDESERSIAEEVTREQLYLNLSQELPYATKVETDLWQVCKNGHIKIYQSIYVLKHSQKNIVLGKGGGMIKTIGQDARKKISTILKKHIHLFLFVKVRENWIKTLKNNALNA